MKKLKKYLFEKLENIIKNLYKISLKKISIYAITTNITAIIYNIDDNINITLLNSETPIKILIGGLIGIMIWRFNGIRNLKKAKVEKKEQIEWLNKQEELIKDKKYGEWRNIEIRELELKALDKHILEKELATGDYYLIGLLLSGIWWIIKITKNNE